VSYRSWESLKPSKCSFCRESVSYLGHIVSREGITTDPEKTAKVTSWPAPKSVQEVQQFLGLSSYYRRFVWNFSEIAKPLHRLTERGRKFTWIVECKTAFATLKNRLASAPILSFPDFTKPFLLDTDASQEGICAVLSQIIEGGERVVSYTSRRLSKVQRYQKRVIGGCNIYQPLPPIPLRPKLCFANRSQFSHLASQL